MEFQGVKRDDNGAYYYDDGDIEKIQVPLSGETQGDVQLSHEQLEEWFGVTESSLPELPAYLIAPRLNSTLGGQYENDPGQDWWYITGGVAVYRPVEWVPTVTRVKEWPENSALEDLQGDEVEAAMNTIYANAEASLETLDGDNYMGVKGVVREKDQLNAEGRLERISTDTDVGDVPVAELALGFMLRVEEVHTHSLQFWMDDRGTAESLSWQEGPGWDEIQVVSDSLANVSGLQFSNIPMSGDGHSQSLYIQALPVLDESKQLTDLHLALSCSSWHHWYAYVVGDKVQGNDSTLLGYPQHAAKSALVPVDQLEG